MSFKNYLLTTLTAKKGRIASFVAGVVTTMLVRNFPIPTEIINEVTIALPFAVAWVIDFVVLQINANGVKEIQEALPPSIKVDGFAGEKTVEAVQNLSN